MGGSVFGLMLVTAEKALRQFCFSLHDEVVSSKVSYCPIGILYFMCTDSTGITSDMQDSE
jgi:hypothetical protein